MGLWKSFRQLFSAQNKISDKELLEHVQKIFGYHFRNLDRLLLALTHRSYIKKRTSSSNSNERLEFLGDSVLGLVIAHQLFRDYPHLREGKMTKLKALLVNETTLALIGKEIRLNEYIRLSPEEERLGGRERPSIISDAFEAVIGAIYLDGGFDAARDVILRKIYTQRDRITTDDSQKNYKGELLEMLQAQGSGMPKYEVVSEKGPDHEKEFSVVVYASHQKLGNGIGFTKKEAEQKAAAMAVEKLSAEEENPD